jgi:uncharacterized protein with HEPN domain
MRESARLITEFLDGVSYTDFAQNKMLQSAVDLPPENWSNL